MSAWTADGLKIRVDGRAAVRRLVIFLALGAVLTTTTWMVQRVGPTQMVTGEGFCPTMEACPVPALGAGFPVAWVVDNPQVSVPGALSFGEDDFRPIAFLLDTAFFALVAAGVATLIRRRVPGPGE